MRIHPTGFASLRSARLRVMRVPIDNLAPDVILTTVDGRPISLAETMGKGQNTLLVFLRHLG
jgi:hypothetical protein